MDKDFIEDRLDENIAKYCNAPGKSVDSLCSSIRTISTCTIVVKGLLIALAACLLSKFFQDPIYCQMLLALAMLWYLNKYTSLRDMIVEDIIRKSYKKSCGTASSEDSKEDLSEDLEDTPAPTS